MIWVVLVAALGTGPTAAQAPQSLLDRPARLDVEEVTIEVALQTLRRTSGAVLAYSSDRLPRERRVTCRCADLTVRQALDRILGGTGLQYREGRRQILIGEPTAPVEGSPGGAAADGSRGVLEGRVLLLPDSQPVSQALVTVAPVLTQDDAAAASPPGARALTTDRDGRFTLRLPPGRYGVTAEALGAAESSRLDVRITAAQETRITILLHLSPIPLEEIVVAPSAFGMLGTRGPSGQILSREEVASRPHPANDIVRAVAQLPGITSTDYSARPVVRGARAEEVMTILDGLELREPYHLKYWDGSLSIVDVENVSAVSFTAGGFTSEYGDKSAGVLSMRTSEPPAGGPRTTIGLDFMSSIVKSEGTFREGEGSWTASARRGFLAFVFDLMDLYPDEDLRPSYYDLFSKVQYQPHPGHRLSAEILHAGDDNHGVEEDSTVYRVRYGNSYGWLTWEADFGHGLSARTLASFGLVSQDRRGTDYVLPGGREILRVRDENTTRTLGLRQDWQITRSDRTMLKWGFDLKQGWSDYDYFRARFSWEPNLTDPQGPDFWPQHDTVAVAISEPGFHAGAYLAGRARVTDRITVETGLRYDRQSWTGQQQVAPRIHASFQLAHATMLRGAWGLYHQSQALDELWIADGNTTFYPAQRAEHRILGLEHRIRGGPSLRIEAYQRLLADPLPEYRRIARNMGALWEESLGTRVFVRPDRGRSDGIELFAKGPEAGPIAWSASYALSRADDRVEGKWVPRPFDQRHAANLQVAVRPGADWSVAAAWVYHSPWPYTEIGYRIEETIRGQPFAVRYPQALNQARLTPYHRIDFRASRTIRSQKGEILLYLDVFNVLNRRNAMDLEQDGWWSDGRLVTHRKVYPQFGVMPSLGLKWGSSPVSVRVSRRHGGANGHRGGRSAGVDMMGFSEELS